MVRATSPQLLLFAEATLLWALATYGVSSDPSGRANRDCHKRWKETLFCRIIGLFGLTLIVSHSWLLATWLAVITLAQSMVRFMLPDDRTAENEIGFVLGGLGVSYIAIHGLQLSPFSIFHIPLRPEHKAALCIVVAALLFSVRGGTYIVRGVLKKAGTLPTIPGKNSGDNQDVVDDREFNRGRLIGNLERITLSIVAAAGSYAALGFLVAAKGLIRFEGIEQSRDFTEYFLIGSLTSVLIALCVGLVIRFTLINLWPELLSLQMQ